MSVFIEMTLTLTEQTDGGKDTRLSLQRLFSWQTVKLHHSQHLVSLLNLPQSPPEGYNSKRD